MPPGELGSEMTANMSARTAAQSGVAGGAASARHARNGDAESSAGSVKAARRFSAGAAALGVPQARVEEKVRVEESGAPTPASRPESHVRTSVDASYPPGEQLTLRQAGAHSEHQDNNSEARRESDSDQRPLSRVGTGAWARLAFSLAVLMAPFWVVLRCTWGRST